MKIYLSCLLSVSFFFCCYDCQDLLIHPSPTAEVNLGEPLTLTCNYSGNNTPAIVRWFLGNDTTGILVSSGTCNTIGTPGTDYEMSRYDINCSILTIRNILENDIADIWGCTVGFTSGPSPNISRTVITRMVVEVHVTEKPPVASTSVPSGKEKNGINGSIVGATIRCVCFLSIIIGGVIVYI